MSIAGIGHSSAETNKSRTLGSIARSNLFSRLPKTLVATVLVLGAPLLIVTRLEATGITSTFFSIILGVGLSFGAASLGSIIWMRFSKPGDIVFADLMIWGWLRRFVLEVQITRSATLLEGMRDGSVKLNPARRSRMLHRLASSLEATDPYTHGHSRRVARHAYMIAKGMGLSRGETAIVRTAAAIHDVGKMHVPVEILQKPGRLTDEEFEEIKKHSVAGAELVSPLQDGELTAIVRHHHERMDGRGYPDAISGDEIPLGARIIAVADTFDAITSSRPYRNASRHSKAIDIIKNEAGTQLDEGAVEAFLAYYSGRRSVAFWAFIASTPHRIVENVITLLRQAVPGGIGSVATGSVTAFVVGTTVLASGVGVQTPASALGAIPTPRAATEVGLGSPDEDASAEVSIHTQQRTSNWNSENNGTRSTSRSRNTTPDRQSGGRDADSASSGNGWTEPGATGSVQPESGDKTGSGGSGGSGTGNGSGSGGSGSGSGSGGSGSGGSGSGGSGSGSGDGSGDGSGSGDSGSGSGDGSGGSGSGSGSGDGSGSGEGSGDSGSGSGGGSGSEDEGDEGDEGDEEEED